MTDSFGVHTFTYDPAGNLSGADHPEGFPVPDEAFGYDPAGNATSFPGNPAGTVAYDPANRLTRDAGHDYGYDQEGNLTVITERGTGLTTRLVWDADHQLTRVDLPDGATVSYSYDPLGRRLQEHLTHPGSPAAGTTTTWAYDGMSIAATWTQTGGAPAVVSGTYTTDPAGTLLSAAGAAGSGRVYAVNDGLGSTTTILDQAGGVTGATAYSAFGVPTPTTGMSVGAGDAYGYTGHAYDPATGFTYARARYYTPATGRFTTEDPIDHPNLYTYVGNQPYDLVDPTGMMAVEGGGLENEAARTAQVASLGARIVVIGALLVAPNGLRAITSIHSPRQAYLCVGTLAMQSWTLQSLYAWATRLQGRLE